MEQKEFFYWLMNKIDKWVVAKEEEKNTGPLKFLQPLNTKQIVATHSYRTTQEQLKTYLLFDVMGLYKNKNDSKVNWSDVKKMIEGTSTKKYNIELNNLNKYFDTKANREHLKKCKLMQDLFEKQPELEKVLEDEALQEEWIPYLLLEDIQNATYHTLGKYYIKYNQKYKAEDWTEEEEEIEKEKIKKEKQEARKKAKETKEERKKREEEEQKKKEDISEEFKRNKELEDPEERFWVNLEKLHKQFLFAVALHEIFWLESYIDVVDNEITQSVEEIQEITEELQKLSSDVIQWLEKGEEFLKRANEVITKQKRLKLLPIRAEISKQFTVSLIAEQQILMMIELLWITDMKNSKWTIPEELKNEIVSNLNAEGIEELVGLSRKNPEREEEDAYKESLEYIKSIFQKIKDSNIDRKQWFENTGVFLEQLEKLEKLVDEKKQPTLEDIWKTQCKMASWIFPEYKDIK